MNTRREILSPSNHVFPLYKIFRIVRDRIREAGGILNSSANPRPWRGFAELSRILSTPTRLRKDGKSPLLLNSGSTNFLFNDARISGSLPWDKKKMADWNF